MPRVIQTGVSEYERYIASSAWKVKRAERIVIDGGKCTRCQSSERLEVHHLNYDRMGDEPMDDLRTLCGRCHAKEHGRDPVVPLTESFERGLRADDDAWVKEVRYRAARVDKELRTLKCAMSICDDTDPRHARFAEIRESLAQMMDQFDREDVAWVKELASRPLR